MIQHPPAIVEGSAQLIRFTPESEAAARRTYIDDIRRYAKIDLAPEDVNIRGARVANTQTTAFFGAFTPEGLKQVAPLLIGKPLMIGHDYGSAPIGRFFAAKTVFMQPTPKTPRKESYWVEALFYTIKGDPEGDAIVRRVDYGVWTELSLGWSVTGLPCRLCGADVRGIGDQFCPHMPGEVYEGGMCIFDFDGVTEVHEASVVFAGAAKGTHFFTSSQSRIAAAAGAGIATPNAIHKDAPGIHALLGAKGQKNPNRPLRRRVAAVLASKDRFDTIEEASDWVRWHQFRTDNAETEGGAFRFHQFKPPTTKPLTIKLGEGVNAVVHEMEEAEATASIDSLL
jgi:hypothetical protein